MAIKNENVKTGLWKDGEPEKKKKTLTSVVDKGHKNQDGDGEAGVDPQVEQLNIQPDPDTHPKEKVSSSEDSDQKSNENT